MNGRKFSLRICNKAANKTPNSKHQTPNFSKTPLALLQKYTKTPLVLLQNIIKTPFVLLQNDYICLKINRSR